MLGYGPNPRFSFRVNFITGGVAMVLVLGALGILVYKFLKKQGVKDPVKPALITCAFFTAIFALLASFRYADVMG